jgi:hypothetical protein
MKLCRFCGKTGLHEFVDLGHQPPSNSFLTKEQLNEPETYYPLKVMVCDSCWLVQLPESKKATKIFKNDYPYYSSQSPSNVSHAKEYVEMMYERFNYTLENRIMEIGGNDGYLLQHFPKGSRVRNIEPAEGPACESIKRGIPTTISFFDKELAKVFCDEFDLICGINVLAHQPDINDFVEGMRIALAPKGIITMEFPHLMRLVEGNQFDTIYHEHYSYFSFATICEIFYQHKLDVFDVDEIPEHGGSLRIYAQHQQGRNIISKQRDDLLLKEAINGMQTIPYYQGFHSKVEMIKTDLVSLLIDLKSEGKEVIAYGAPAKGNTLLNYCGIKSDLVEFIVDRSPYKQGKHLPGSHIRVTDEDELKKVRPDYVLILAWNLKEEVMEQLSYIKEWGGQFIIPIPELEVI